MKSNLDNIQKQEIILEYIEGIIQMHLLLRI